jgi:DNA/RNA-binding domain of Phe-tRNA-synthetase-like protein
MLIVQIAKDVLEQYPEAHIRLIVAHHLDNMSRWPDVEHRVSALEAELSAGTWRPFTESDLQIASWHDAFRKFGTNPRRSRPSLDALSRRIAKTGKFPRINPAVDAYNYVSVLFGTPAGAFDQTLIDGEIRIRFASNGELFTPLGQPEEVETLKEGEVIYADQSRVLTRHWNHRDCDQTKVTNQSQNVLFIAERVSSDAVSDESMDKAQEVLGNLLTPYASGLFKATLSKESPSALLPKSTSV